MKASVQVLAGAALLALLPAMAHAQAVSPLAAPMPAPKPAPAEAGAVLATDGEGEASAFAPSEDVGEPSAPEQAPAAPAALRGATLFGDPTAAADLEALLEGASATAAAPTPASGADAAAASGVVADSPLAPPAGDPAAPGAGAASASGILAVAPAPESDAVPRPALMPAPPVESPLVWDDAPLDAEKAARLFEVACLATLPEFAGVGAFFDSLGFQTVPGMRIRNHPRKNVSALATTPTDLMESGVRSCAILVEGLEHAPARAAVEARVASRFGPTPRFETPAKGLAHVVWVVETAFGPAKITVTESSGSAFLGATVLPPPPVGEQ